MSGYLELADGAMVGVRDGLVLGRVASCDVVVADTKASRRHARLIVEAGVVEVEDMGSSNGTMLNGKPVDRRMLRDGDRIEIGKTSIVYREGELPGRSKASASAGSVDLFEDDDDLFGDGDASEAAPAAASSPSPSPPDSDLLGEEDDLLGGGDVAQEPPAPSPPAADVVEFEDEVVEVQSAPPPRRAEPAVEVRAASRERGGSGDGAERQPASGRILQYSKQKGGGGLLGDDLNQMSGGKKWLLVLLVVGAGAGVVYGITQAMG